MKIYAFKLSMPKIGILGKMLLIMKLTTFILISTFIQLSAKSFSRRITLVKSNISIESVLNHIKTQIGYSILYKDINLSKHRININLKDESLEDALKASLTGLSIEYKIESRTKIIILRYSKPSVTDMATKIFQNFFRGIDVRGKIVDSAGVPIVGAVIKIKGTNISTATNNNGEFLLKNVDENAFLIISHLGYKKKEIKVVKDLGSIELAHENTNLEEVKINAGYYTVTERERTGSISRVTAKDIERQPVSNVLQAMQANIPGVEITQTSGVPGGGFNVQIRGKNSISQGNEPFYVIDGVPFTANAIVPVTVGLQIAPNPSPLANINPLDIESIEVLKDADATAIYGSRGANGVILITTKKGKDSEAKILFSIVSGISRVGNKIDLLNTQQYLEMRKEAYFTNDELTTTSPQYATQYDINGAWNPNKYTDWQEELIGRNAPITTIQTSLSGGAGMIQYKIGGNYYNEKTVFPGEHSFNRKSGTFSLQYRSKNEKINASFSANYTQSNSDLFSADIAGYIFLPPNYPDLLQADGSLNWGNDTMQINPMADTRNPYETKINNLVSSGMLSYSFLPELEFKTNVGYTTMAVKNYSARLLSTQSPLFTLQRGAGFGNNSIDTWIVEPQLNWNRQLGKGKLDVILGSTFQEDVTDGQNISATGYTSDALLGNIGAASTLAVSSRQYLQYRYAAIYSRFNFTYNNRYILNLTARRDGSTRFGDEKRFANFGALGAVWIISDENFLKKLSFISFAKLRGSYGVTGNDKIGDYAYLALWGNNLAPNPTYQDLATIKPEGLANRDYSWEVNKKAELALELRLLKDKINFSVGFYSNISSNQLLDKQLPPTIGFTSIRDNLPAKVSNTGWEFTLSANSLIRNRFNWSTSINLTIPKNKLVSYPGLKTSGNDALFYEIGYPLDIKRLYNTYLDNNTGLYVTEDFDGNGVIDNSDKYLIRFNGRRYYGGIQNQFTYKGIELDFTFQFVNQNRPSSLQGGALSAPGRFLSNQPIAVLDHWKAVGDNARFQKYGTTSATARGFNNSIGSGHLTLEDASFIRLKNVSVSYNLPDEIVRRIRLNGIRFYLQGQNLFVITKYEGLDPEAQNPLFLPTLQAFTAGIQITF